MNFRTLLLLSLLSCAYLGKAQEVDTLKYWSSSDKLKWTDFQGKIPSTELTSSTRAVCPHEIIVSPYREKGALNYRVELVFLKKLAWGKDTSRYTLSHEQLHFDIAELYSRKLRKSINDVKARSGSTDDFKMVIEDILSSESKAQVDFDQETAHGIYQTKQLEWAKKVAKELDELKKYASDKQ
jgi:hypothetical protein